MGRDNYDDMTTGPIRNGRPHRGDNGNGSRRLILVVVVIGVLLCAIAVFLWLKLFPADTKTARSPVPAVTAMQPAAVDPGDLPVRPAETTVVNPIMPVAETTDSAAMLPATAGSLTDVQMSPAVAVAPATPVVPAEASSSSKPTDAVSGTTARSLDAVRPSATGTAKTIQYADHVVAEGEDLASIAATYGLRPQTIISVNQIKNVAAITAGSVLRIPDRDGQLYVVQEGDMLSTISRKFSPSLGWKTLQELNGLTSENIRVGQVLFIPDTSSTATSSPTVSTTRFIQPATGRIVALYGQAVTDPATNATVVLDGIRIQGRVGAAVNAAAAGMVVDAGYDPKGRGRFIQISHEGGYKTTYEHLESVGVKVGSQVRQGEPLGSMGTTGTEFTEPTLFFKIEQGGIALDPTGFFQ